MSIFKVLVPTLLLVFMANCLIVPRRPRVVVPGVVAPVKVIAPGHSRNRQIMKKRKLRGY